MDYNTFNNAHEDDISTKYLTFIVNEQHYGLPITQVIEIVQVQPMTALPELPPYAKGIINMRGRVIPIIDINLRFGKPENEYTDRTCVIIVDIGGVYVGFVVDGVEEVVDIEHERVSAPPGFSAEYNRFVSGIGKMEDHMVLLLDAQLLISDQDMNMFAQASR